MALPDPGLPVPTELTNTVTKEESQAQHPQSNWCGNCCYNTEMKGQREDEQNPKTDPVSPALGSPRKGCQGTYRVLWPLCGPQVLQTGLNMIQAGSPIRGNWDLSTQIFWQKELGILLPHPLSCVVPTQIKYNIIFCHLGKS